MYDRKRSGRKLSAVITGSVLAAALTVAQIAPVSVLADETTEANLTLSESEADAENTESAETEEAAAEEETQAAEEETQAAEEETQAAGEETQAAEEDAEASDEGSSSSVQLETTSTGDGLVTAVDVSSVVEAVMPSVVMITEKGVSEVMDYFGQTQQVETLGAASGFIIAQNDDEILIATNNHVVEDSTEVTVAFSVETEDKTEDVFEARVKGTDSATDLAVVAVKTADVPEEILSQLKIAVLGSSEDLKVGQTAITIGNAQGEGLSVSAGIVSALDVEIEVEGGSSYTEFQTDGATNQGQSGGPVVNAKGEVIGIFNAGNLSGENMGYSVPISTAIPVLQELINRETRDVVENHGYIGVVVVPVSDEASEMYNIPKGAYVYEVQSGSAADEAGIQEGDIITSFDGITIDSQETLLRQIEYYEAGETVEVTVSRPEGSGYEEKTFELTLQEGTSQTTDDASASDSSDSDSQDQSSQDGSGSLQLPDSSSDQGWGFGFGGEDSQGGNF